MKPIKGYKEGDKEKTALPYLQTQAKNVATEFTQSRLKKPHVTSTKTDGHDVRERVSFVCELFPYINYIKYINRDIFST